MFGPMFNGLAELNMWSGSAFIKTGVRTGLNWTAATLASTYVLCRLLPSCPNFREQDREFVSSEDEAQTKFWEQVGGAELRFKTGIIQRSIRTINYK